jgi:regulatory protein
MKYCAYQERTQQEVRDKLYGYGLYPDAVEEVLTDLISEDFINEERYAQSFARGKFRQNQWGRIKIRLGLQQKKISAYCIKQGLREISEADYRETLQSLMQRKWNALEKEEAYARKQKTVRYVLSKGYEADLAWQVMNEVIDT